MRRNSNALERSNGSLNRAKLVPKYKGCGPGGKHGSVMAINPNQTSSTATLLET